MKKSVLVFGLTLLMGAGVAFAAKITEEQVTRPAGSVPFEAERAFLVAKGELLWNDKSLSKSGKKACSGCHKGATKMFKDSFGNDYPHAVKMAKKKAKMSEVNAEQMVQFCMLAAMKQPNVLPWDSEELAALTAYTVDVVQKNYIAHKAK